MKHLIVTHRDADGITSAISYAMCFLERNNKDISLSSILNVFDILDINYGEDIFKALDKKHYNLDNYESFVLLDFSLDIEIMRYLRNKFKEKFIWIDHHKLACENIEKDIKDITGVRNQDKAACLLVYDFFEKEIPEFAKYINDMDLWNWELENSKELFSGLRNLKDFFSEDLFEYVFELLHDSIFKLKKQDLIFRGQIILDYENDFIKYNCRLGGITEWQGYSTFVINATINPGKISDYILINQNFNSIDVVFVWYKTYLSNLYKISLRSRKTGNVDVSLLAFKFPEGGGHKNAAGFVVDDLYKTGIDF